MHTDVHTEAGRLTTISRFCKLKPERPFQTPLLAKTDPGPALHPPFTCPASEEPEETLLERSKTHAGSGNTSNSNSGGILEFETAEMIAQSQVSPLPSGSPSGVNTRRRSTIAPDTCLDTRGGRRRSTIAPETFLDIPRVANTHPRPTINEGDLDADVGSGIQSEYDDCEEFHGEDESKDEKFRPRHERHRGIRVPALHRPETLDAMLDRATDTDKMRALRDAFWKKTVLKWMTKAQEGE